MKGKAAQTASMKQDERMMMWQHIMRHS